MVIVDFDINDDLFVDFGHDLIRLVVLVHGFDNYDSCSDVYSQVFLDDLLCDCHGVVDDIHSNWVVN